MRATIKMIAEQAGVSIGTVDRVIHNRPYVKAEVRGRVLRVMEELDYRPNQVASALATSGTVRRMVLIQPSWSSAHVRSSIAEGVAQFREERRDYNVQVEEWEYTQDDNAQCLRLLCRAEEIGAQAIALCATDCEEIRVKIGELAEKRIPVVTFNSDISGAARLCYVGEDGYHAGRIAGEIASKFLCPGETFLLAYAGPAYAAHKARADGFLDCLEARGFRREDCRIAETHNDYEQTLSAVTEALKADPNLRYIYMANLSVPACVEAIRRCGKEGCVRILSHDSGPKIRELLKAGVVDFTIDQDLVYQSYQALTVLFRAIAEHRLPEQDCFYPASPILNAETIG